MSVFNKYTSVYENTNEPLFLQYDIDIMRLDSKYAFESASGISCGIYITEAEEVADQSSSFNEWVTKLIERVRKFISDAIDMVKDIFSDKKHLYIEDYLNSESGQIQFEYDIQKIQDNVDAELRKGRKLVQAISKGTKIDDRTVEAYVDNAGALIKKYAKPTIITSGAIVQINNTDGRLKKMSAELGHICDDTKKLKDEPDKYKAVRKIIKAATELASEATKIGTIFIKQVEIEARENEKKSRRAKKHGNL